MGKQGATQWERLAHNAGKPQSRHIRVGGHMLGKVGEEKIDLVMSRYGCLNIPMPR